MKKDNAIIGHVHLTVGDLERSLGFYRDLLGFEVTSYISNSAVFLSRGGYHHHIGLNTWSGKGVIPPPRGHSGLYHFAILFPTRRELAEVLKRIIDAGYQVTGFSDHGVSEAIYLDDPDGIGVELCCDRPKEEWNIGDDGHVEMVTEPMDINDLLNELNK
ncbi:MAG: Biphenyl-2,3-diol 1,2-dioxygenase [Parcubacteria bacterium C7867-006]|nr:MAG: Biphenyl-2,3-diol 1,2-dioxygenase [Parcubacteria bacterium C7867-006]